MKGDDIVSRAPKHVELLHPRHINDKQKFQECVESGGGSKSQVAIGYLFKVDRWRFLGEGDSFK